MSWMDSWSRPGKHSAVPPPLYLTQGNDVTYCRTCGRVITPRKSKQDNADTVKYCSDRCRHRKPGALDKKIENTIVDLLNAEPGSGIDQTAAGSKLVKGDRRIIITCDEVEQIVFGSRHDPSKTFGRRKNRASRALGDQDEEWKSVDMVDTDDSSLDHPEQTQQSPQLPPGPRIRPAQIESAVNGSVGGEKGWAERHEETSDELKKRLEGQRRAEEREMVRRAARRLIVFGRPIDTAAEEVSKGQSKIKSRAKNDNMKDVSDSATQHTRKCEALMNGAIVEPSFAKGDWSIRWREEV